MEGKRRIKIVLDTNVFISALLKSNTREFIRQIVYQQNFTVVYSAELLEEFIKVSKRKKFLKHVSTNQVNRFVKILLPTLKEIKVKSEVKRSRDSQDDFLLALAQDSKARYLITGDADLLVLEKHLGTRILTISEFKQKFNLP